LKTRYYAQNLVGSGREQKRERDGREKPVIKIGKKSRAATKVSWELFRGEIPESMQIRQTCKVDLCVNPDHLELIRQSYGRI